jgi:hypothetical protein
VIHVFDDSDTSGAGELSFSGAVYDATVAGGARLTEPQFSAKREVDSGQDFDSPFDNLLAVDRAPDRIGIFVIGRDDDRDASDILLAPSEGLGLVGFRPPDRLPTGVAAVSTHSRDQSEALGLVTLPNFTPRSAKPFSFESINGALHFSCSGHVLTNVIDTLGERAVPPWKLVKRTKMMLVRDQRSAGMLGLRSGRVALALSAEGVLSVRSEAAATWQVLAGPPLDVLLIHILHDGSQLLAGRDGAGRLSVARVQEVGAMAPRWEPLAADARDLPLTVEGGDRTVHLLGGDADGGLWHARIEADGALAQPPRPLDLRADSQLAAAPDRNGQLVVAVAGGDDMLHLLTLERGGGLADRRRLDGRFTTPLAIAADPQEGLLLAALDREDRIGVCLLDDSAADFEDLGPLDELLEGPLPSVPLAPPAAA